MTFADVKARRGKLTRQEEIKQAKDGLDVLPDLYRYAASGFESIPEPEFERFKWYGFYRQKPKNSGYFMLRTKIPGGQFNAAQGKVIASLVEKYARGFLDITTRQTFQMHWLRVEDVPDIFGRLNSVGMTTSGACGDDTRNVVGCPVAGVDKDEIFDGTEFNRAVSQYMTFNRDFSNMPRKYKISISGCHLHCAQPDINCLSLFGVIKKDGTRGFGVKVGGGLSAAPHMAQCLPIFVPLDVQQVIEVVKHISTIYRDEGYRDARTCARLKFLMADWGAAKFTAELQKRIGRELEPGEDWVLPNDPETDHFGVHEQKQAGLYYVTVSCLGGRISAEKLRQISELSETFGDGQIRNTNKQNLIIINVPKPNLKPLLNELDSRGLMYQGSPFRKGGVSCTGIEFCNLAVAETKNRLMLLVDQLEEMHPNFDSKIRIHFSGCPSACGQHQIAEIGFRGKSWTENGDNVDGFDMFLGGGLGANRKFNQLVYVKIPSRDLHHYVARALAFYDKSKSNGESFKDFFARTGRDKFEAELKQVQQELAVASLPKAA
jgi:ferredoxin-nitrite reductase